MSEVAIDASKTKIEVSNNGVITFISASGNICLIHVHPSDTKLLVNFLVKEEYDFSK